MLKGTLLLAAAAMYRPLLCEPANARRKVSSSSQFKRFLRFSINKSISAIITDFRLRVVNCHNFDDGHDEVATVELILSARDPFMVLFGRERMLIDTLRRILIPDCRPQHG